MLILNFGHVITQIQLDCIEELANKQIVQVIRIRMKIAPYEPLEPQVVDIIDSTGLTRHQWETQPIPINLPGHLPAAVCIIAEIAGRIGYLPAIIVFRPVTGIRSIEYEVSEIINLQALRDEARIRGY